MSPDQQRIAIAEACGWTNFNSGTHKGAIQYGQPPNARSSSWELPNYLNDLNAMHEAEQVLTAAQLTVYRNTLAMMNGGIFMDDGGSFVHLGFAVSATARQRAEAFLRTLNLWTESPTQPQ